MLTQDILILILIKLSTLPKKLKDQNPNGSGMEIRNVR
jgi:hypothetical protein